MDRPRPGLAREIKDRIPARLVRHRMDTISIIVDLRISRLAAAAAILFIPFVLLLVFERVLPTFRHLDHEPGS